MPRVRRSERERETQRERETHRKRDTQSERARKSCVHVDVYASSLRHVCSQLKQREREVLELRASLEVAAHEAKVSQATGEAFAEANVSLQNSAESQSEV